MPSWHNWTMRQFSKLVLLLVRIQSMAQKGNMDTKICPTCKRELSIDNFCKNKNTSDKLFYCCRECKSEYNKKYKRENAERIKEYASKYRLDNVEKIRESAKRSRLKRRNFVQEYKTSIGCAVCGEKDPDCLVFHHRKRGDKVASISVLLQRNLGKKKLLAEIKKCDVLCSNCHKKLHFDERKDAEAGYAGITKRLVCMATEYKNSRGCGVCGEMHPGCLVFHHRKPEYKICSISDGLRRHLNEKKLTAEIKKCDVLCSNCHMKIHAGKRSVIKGGEDDQ